MCKRIKNLFVFLMTVILLFQMPASGVWCGLMAEVYGLTITDGSETISTTVEEEVIVGSGGTCTVTDTGVLNQGVKVGYLVNGATLVNNGTINGDLQLYGGSSNTVVNGTSGKIQRGTTWVYENGVFDNRGYIYGINVIGGNFSMSSGTVDYMFVVSKHDETPHAIEIFNGKIGYLEESTITGKETAPNCTEPIYLGNVTLGQLKTSQCPLNVGGMVNVESADIYSFGEGSGTVNVTDSISLTTGNQSDVTINVEPDTEISASAASLVVTCAGKNYEYGTAGGVTSGSVKSNFGKTVKVNNAADGSVKEVAGLDSSVTYWYGEKTATAKYAPAEGYYFPDDYGTNVKVSAGTQSALSVTQNGNNEITVQYTISNSESVDDIIIQLPKATKQPAETNSISSGTPVQLNAGTAYTLGAGQWTVGGDATVYGGNISFYVKQNGTYTFTQK